MYHVSISFGSRPITEPFGGDSANFTLGVLVTDAATGAPVTGLEKSQFTVYAWVTETTVAPDAYEAQTIENFLEAASYAPLPGLYSMTVEWTTGAAGSNPFAVTVTDRPPLRPTLEPPLVLGIGIGTYTSA
jgi:hypothetical protein